MFKQLLSVRYPLLYLYLSIYKLLAKITKQKEQTTAMVTTVQCTEKHLSSNNHIILFFLTIILFHVLACFFNSLRTSCCIFNNLHCITNGILFPEYPSKYLNLKVFSPNFFSYFPTNLSHIFHFSSSLESLVLKLE